MKKSHLELLACPDCKASLDILENQGDESDSIESGSLQCSNCNHCFPIIRHIPRFVPLENYASGFGFQWVKHSRTQYDSHTGANASEERFFEETKWPRDLSGQFILEVGSGSGRFTEQAARTNATVVSMDYSVAVEANYASNGDKENVLIVQADIYKMPFNHNFFDKLYCFGVLQHTPDVEKSFSVLPSFLKSGGKIAADVYRKYSFFKEILRTKHWIRPITKEMNPEFLYKITSNYVKLMWPLCKIIHNMPYGKNINWALFVGDYRGKYDLNEYHLREWAILDTFDMLSPAYDNPQTINTMRKWFRDNNLQNMDIQHGPHGGVEVRGVKP